MGDRWITDIQHFLEDGEIPEGLPSRALAIALHLGSIVSWVTSRRPTQAPAAARREPLQAAVRCMPSTVNHTYS